MSEAVHHLFLAGGKRFRPLFTVLSASLGPDPDSAQVTVAGAVIEMVHLATLYDDVMDEAQVPRRPSANARWATTSRSLARRLPVRHRVATGVAAGSRRGADHRGYLRRGWSPVRCGGPGAPRTASDEVEHYLKVVYEKTACLIAASGRFGGTFSGRTPEQVEQFVAAGRSGGHGLPDLRRHHRHRERARESGKLPGTDLREGVHTLPVLYALRDVGPAADRLRQLLAADITDESVAEALNLLRESNGIPMARRWCAATPSRPAPSSRRCQDCPAGARWDRWSTTR